MQSVERAAAVMRLLAGEDQPLTLGAIADALGLAKGTARGLLLTLQEVGFVEQDRAAGPYRIAPGLFDLGRTRLDPNELRSLALNWTDALAARSGESVRLATWERDCAVVAHHVFGNGRRQECVTTGAVVPLHASALGKVILAYDPGAARSTVGVELEPLTHRTITDRRVLIRELARVRDAGWAVSVEEDEVGTAAIAAPVRDAGGHVVAAVGVQGPCEVLCDIRGVPRPRLVELVVSSGRSISDELGHGRS